MNRRVAAIAELERVWATSSPTVTLLERALTHASVGTAPRKVRAQRAAGVPRRPRAGPAGRRDAGRRAHPDWREGELTRRHATLVAGKTCADVARRVGLPDRPCASPAATSKQGGRDNDRILGDAMEALMAAVYLDGGLGGRARRLRRGLDRRARGSRGRGAGREPKTRAAGVGDGGRPAAARAIARSRAAGRDHAPLFTVEVAVEGHAPGARRSARRCARPRRPPPGAAATARARHDRSTRAGFVAVIGAPNAGKSTLVNRLVGSKVSIVTQKVQTTRFPVRGVAIEGEAQIVLVDTPGIFQPRRRLDRAMVRAAWGGAAGRRRGRPSGRRPGRARAADGPGEGRRPQARRGRRRAPSSRA